MPRNWNKEQVQIRRLLLPEDDGGPIMDRVRRELAGEPRYTPLPTEDPEVFYAQVKMDKQEKRDRQRAGGVPETAGRLVYGFDVTPLKQGDRIVGLKKPDGTFRVVDYVICGMPEDKGHLHGAARFLRSLFVEGNRFVAR